MSVKGDITDFVRSLTTSIDSSTRLRSMRLLSDFILDMIYVRTRLGYGVSSFNTAPRIDPNLKKVRLKKISNAYKVFRDAARSGRRKGVVVSPDAATGKSSNLTLTGQMLNSLKLTQATRRFIISPTGLRKDGKKNADVALWVSRAGRPFLDLYDLEQKKVQIYYRKTFRDLLKENKLLK